MRLQDTVLSKVKQPQTEPNNVVIHMVDKNVDSIDKESRTAIKEWVGRELGCYGKSFCMCCFYWLMNKKTGLACDRAE